MTVDELLAKAEKKMTTTLTRWKPDYLSLIHISEPTRPY